MNFIDVINAGADGKGVKKPAKDKALWNAPIHASEPPEKKH